MRLLLDENLSPRLVEHVARLFPDSVHFHDVGLGSALDTEVWDYALESDCTILSKDSDFSTLSFQRGHPPKVIWVRRGNCSTRGILALIKENHEFLLEFAADPETVLELVHRDDLAQALNAFVENHDARWVPLRPDALSTGMPRLERWKLIVNESVEPDL